MVFNSFVFIEFALVFFAAWYFVRGIESVRYVFLIVCSCLFYGFGGWWFVPLLLATATVDFYAAHLIYKYPDRKKLFLVLSLVSNLGALGTFKYAGFICRTINDVAAAAGVHAQLVPVPSLILPIGISFYTFQSLSYIFDVYRGDLVPAKRLSHFLSIVTLFPHLVAGPIVRIRHILPQMERLRKPTTYMVWSGLRLVAFGLFKKSVLADNLAPFVDSVYRDHSTNGYALLLATIAFAFQIYYDFSGYTDIARGLAKWLGVEFTLNFNHPYSSIGVRDFWSRWHISLSYWIRDYVYITAGGSRGGELKTYRNIWIAMVVSGIWHGANWTYVFWGALHALYQSIERFTKWPERLSNGPIPRLVGVVITFTIVSIAWIFFRAESIHEAFRVCANIVNFGSYGAFPYAFDGMTKAALAFSIASEAFYISKRHLNAKIQFSLVLQAIAVGVAIAASIYLKGPGKAFIYFEF